MMMATCTWIAPNTNAARRLVPALRSAYNNRPTANPTDTLSRPIGTPALGSMFPLIIGGAAAAMMFMNKKATAPRGVAVPDMARALQPAAVVKKVAVAMPMAAPKPAAAAPPARPLPQLNPVPAWWNEAAYLRENPDVATWTRANPMIQGQKTSGWAHWDWWARGGTDRQATRTRIRADKAAFEKPAVVAKPAQPATVVKKVAVAMPMTAKPAVAAKQPTAVLKQVAVANAMVVRKPVVVVAFKPAVAVKPSTSLVVKLAKPTKAGMGSLGFAWGAAISAASSAYSAYSQSQQQKRPPASSYSGGSVVDTVRTVIDTVKTGVNTYNAVTNKKPAAAASGPLAKLVARPAWWDEAAYLKENLDVAAWLKANPTIEGQPTSGWAHWSWWARGGTDRPATRARIQADKAAFAANGIIPSAQRSAAAAAGSSNTTLYLVAAGAAALLLMRNK